MKTYTKQITVTKPRLEISYDPDAENPRNTCDNLGYFITVDNRHTSPDQIDWLERIVKDTGEEATSRAEHLKLIIERFNEFRADNNEKVLAIYPVVKHEHGNVSYSLGTQHGFDYSNNGFYIVTDKTAKLIGTPELLFEKVIKQELDMYTKWLNGEVYGFTLYDEQGNWDESCWGYYDIEDIRESLPKEFENENLTDYIIE